MRISLKTCLLGLVLVLSLSGVALSQGAQPSLITGAQWQGASQEMKSAYIRGVGNMADYDVAVSGKGKAGYLSVGLVNELKGKSIEGIVKDLDKFYKDNPDKLNTPVMEVVVRQCTNLCKPAAPSKK
jgi:hypothetical protein